jgi:glycosyltransferase involved in cell wall biosynthesis
VNQPAEHPGEPIVSILLPAFNAAKTLDACLRSIRRQVATGWECVVVDDGSTDDTLSRANRFARHDGRFRVVAFPHRGLVKALNAGLEHCRGAYIARLDADDLMHSERLRQQIDLMERRRELAAAGCHVRIFPRAGLGPGTLAYERWLNGMDSAERVRRDAFVECPVCHPTMIIRSKIMRELGYRDLGWPEDYDLILRLIVDGKPVGMLPRRRLLWRHGPERLSHSNEAYSRERFNACKAAFLSRSFLAGRKGFMLWGYGHTGKAMCATLRAHGKRPSHIVELHPGRLGNRINGAEVVPPSRLRELPRRPLLVSVAGARPRNEIRKWLTGAGFVELRDYVCVA